jgi:hypothetical protein
MVVVMIVVRIIVIVIVIVIVRAAHARNAFQASTASIAPKVTNVRDSARPITAGS